jgi:hypothetical protein
MNTKRRSLFSRLVGCRFEVLFILLSSCYTVLKDTDLNEALNEFYTKHAQKETVEAWLDKHPYHLAMDDCEDAQWMAQ